MAAAVLLGVLSMSLVNISNRTDPEQRMTLMSVTILILDPTKARRV